MNENVYSLKKNELRALLESYKLSNVGERNVMLKRVEHYQQKKIASEISCLDHLTLITKQIYQYILVIDFEATCEASNPFDYRHEIIEFPLVLFDTVSGEVCETFREICRPKLHPNLSDFCCQLTGISQAEVEKAASFTEVLSRAETWMISKGLDKSNFLLLCDCNADCGKFLRIQSEISGVAFPLWARRWHNLRKALRNYYRIPYDENLSLQSMLAYVGLRFEGRAHSGLDDAMNILRVAKVLMADGCLLRLNERIDMNATNYVTSMGPKEAECFPRGSGHGWPRKDRPSSKGAVAHPRQTRKKCADVTIDCADSVLSQETDESLADLMRYVKLRDT